MDLDNTFLSHQVEAVCALAEYFEHVWVVTGHAGRFEIPSNVTVIDSDWVKDRFFSNTFKFYKIILPLLIKKNLVVFSHMTDVQCALISPLTKFFRKRHLLWYAHKTKSIYLKWSSFWVSGILTSTKGSCPILGKKVSVIGQAINLETFWKKPRKIRAYNKWVHIGRFDPSKNIDEIIDLFHSLKISYPELTFEQVGKPSTKLAKNYADKVIKQNEYYIEQKRLTFSDSISRIEIANKLNQFELFVHCYAGSLDKSLLEATSCGIPVITINPEYLKEFGSWSELSSPSLQEEFYALTKLNTQLVEQELLRRIEHIRANHSLVSWSTRVVHKLQTT